MSTVVVVGYEACYTCLVAALLVAHHASPSLQQLRKVECRHNVSLRYTKGANTWHSLRKGHTNDETQRTINTLFSVARTNMVPTTVALRRMLSWVPTPIALRRLHLFWFRFQHTQVWVWAPCWPSTDFARGNAPWSTCLKKRGKMSHESLTHGVVTQTNKWNTPHFTLWVAASRARGPLSAG